MTESGSRPPKSHSTTDQGSDIAPAPSALAAFDYACEAELFPTRPGNGRRRALSYRRFARSADAIQFAIETLPPHVLLGTSLEVDEQRYASDAIRRLYDSASYPLARPPRRLRQ